VTTKDTAMNTLNTLAPTFFSARLSAFACALFVTASLLGGIDALAISEAPAHLISMTDLAPAKGV